MLTPIGCASSIRLRLSLDDLYPGNKASPTASGLGWFRLIQSLSEDCRPPDHTVSERDTGTDVKVCEGPVRGQSSLPVES
jgi:hypothetical protein